MPEDSIAVCSEEEYIFAKGALHGGKTDVRVLHRKWTEEDIKSGKYGSYVDVQSMYPFVQYKNPMPSGIPEWKSFDASEEVDLDFLRSFMGIVECDLHPTKYLHHPIIGGRDPATKKYVFDLKPKKRVILTSVEVQVALKQGYKVTKIYRALVYKEQQVLFQSYVKKFLKIKLECSGLPKEDWEIFAAKHESILGILLDKDRMIRNDGLREMAKLMLNSLWGKLGQDPNLPHSILVDNESNYKDFLKREFRGEVSLKYDLDIAGNKKIISYVDSQGNMELQNKNVIIAAFVAAYGRLYLWESLNLIGDRVLYHDTDSIVYERTAAGPNIPIGSMLGEWEDELDGDYMISFVALGPKTYSYLTSKGKKGLKCKGFALNSGNSESLNHSKMIDLLNESKSTKEACLTLSDRKFKWDRAKGEYWTYLQQKTMRFTADKNVIDWVTLTTKPFGYELFE